MPLTPGTRLGPYEMVSQLGQGGMGVVYEARDPRLKRTVAIKLLPPELTRDETAKQRFLQEAQAASALDHPNICTIHEINETDDGQLYLVMAHYEGETLKERIARGPLKLDNAIDIATQVGEGLAKAHAAGIVHRDIKAANLMVTADDTVKILDFGLAKLAGTEGMTQTGTTLGTVAYMSPEQARGQEVDHRTDIWSLGVVLYEMLAGKPPFQGENLLSISHAIAESDPAALTGSSSPAQSVVAQALRKAPTRRCQSVSDLLGELRKLQSASAAPTVTTSSQTEVPSIAVLPFTNMSPDPEQEYFSDGLADEIITDLSQIRTLRVISRSSSIQLKGSGQDLKAVASKLNVRYVLEGSVRKSGNAVRVNALLVDPVRDEHLWAEKYSGKLEDIFDIQEQISRKIVDALKMQLSPHEDRKLADRAFDNVEAFECYHRARREIYRFTEEGLEKALELIQTALDIVGENELLFAAMGSVYRQYFNAAIKSDVDYIEKAEECARKVFALDPESAVGHELMGMVHLARGGMADAVWSFKRSLALHPDSPYALRELGRVYLSSGCYREARSMHQKALAVDPLSPITQAAFLCNEMFAGHGAVVHRDAPVYLRSEPDFPMLRWPYVLSLIHSQQSNKALEVLEAAPEEKTPTIAGRVCLLLKLALQGKRSEATECIGEELLAGAWNVEWWSWCVGECYAFIEEDTLALDWLEHAVERGFIHYPYLSEHSSILRKLDDNPRFQELLGKVRIAWEQFEP